VIARTEKRNKSGNMTPYPTGRGRPLTPERQALKQQAIILRKMGWSQPRIAKQIGIPQRTISLWFSKNGEFAIHAKPIRVSNNDKANIPANPTFLSWCGKLEDFTPENGTLFDLIIADPPWNVSTNNEIKRTSRRLAVKKHFGFQDIFTDDEYLDREEVEIWIIRNQFGRRNLSPYQRSVLVLKLKDIFQRKAKEKQKEGGVNKVLQKSGEPLRTDKELAKTAHVSHDTIYKDLAECKNGENTENGKPDPLRIAYITEGQINYRRFPGVSLLRGIYRTNKE